MYALKYCEALVPYMVLCGMVLCDMVLCGMVLCGMVLCDNGSDGLREMSVSYERLLSSVIPTTQEGWCR